MGRLTLSIKGMHCHSCELLLEDRLKEVPKVSSVHVSHAKGTAEIEYASEPPVRNDLDHAIREAGYDIGIREPSKWLSRNAGDYRELVIAGVILVILYYVARGLGLLDISLQTSALTYPFAFAIGLVAGLSTCMAIVGGLVLGISARHAELHPDATPWQKFRPHLYFNMGRIGGYAVLGGLLGVLGGAFRISGSIQTFLMLAVGAVMIVLGLKLTGVSPRLTETSIALPSSLSKWLGVNRHQKEYSHRSAVMTGVLTFFLPCGFTQAVQLAAIGTGRFESGAMLMGLFALGTAPALLSIGGLTSVIKGKIAKRFYATVGLAVFVFGLFNLNSGLALAGFGGFLPAASVSSSAGNGASDVTGGYQIVRMTQTAGGYRPNTFTVKKGIPVKWIITSESAYSCAASILMPAMNISQRLNAGENVIEFTPTQTGQLPFSCSMGMYRGVFSVVDGPDAGAKGGIIPAAQAAAAPAIPSGGSCGGGGCGCGGGAAQRRVPAPAADVASDDAGVVRIASRDNAGLTPNEFTVKSGQAIEWTITPDAPPAGCMTAFVSRDLGISVRESYPDATVIRFTAPAPGDYDVTCAMGMWRAAIHVK